ncbi:putative MFS transporter [Aaosphaeria arxii CBS 175.79]|uniref:Putative MFS transporter n=1 Tax=Aaosphaeria arxii CBS 175.79 TaxID=1450172 RepID=A0A6A5XEU5_9PLEO|nr:putative MFS transporter [Aaosphaeria arxii CBS 175.79]KAF2011628.1 putative MFS transporter [Aaosphaeria arxii CBS 175.79]
MEITPGRRATVDDSATSKKDTQFNQLSIEEPESGNSRTQLRTFAIMTGLCATVFLAALNQTSVATAIPTITRELNSASGYAWISAAYFLANAAAAPIWSKLSDIWGRKLILLTAVALYFVFSIICATAITMQMLIIGRALQGVAGGGLLQIVYATISDIFSMRARTFYLGLLQLMWATAGGLGPLVGGIFAQYVTWRWIFWINLPIAFIVFVVLWIFLDVHDPKTGIIPGLQAIDWFGIFSLLACMVTFLLGLNFGRNNAAWSSPLVICLLVTGVAMATVFVFFEKKARSPIIPMELFGNMSNVGTMVIGFTHDWAVFSIEFYLPLFFQAVKSATPLSSGIRILPITLTQSLVGVAAGIIVHRSGRYLELIWVGVALLALGNGLYINLDVSTALGPIIAFQVVASTGAGLLFQPPLIALQALVPPHKTASATATLGLVRILSISIAIVAGHVIFASGMNSHNSELIAQGLPRDLAESFAGAAAAANVELIGAVEDLGLRHAVQEAFADSLRYIWILCTCTSVCAVVASAFVSRQVLSREHVEYRTGLSNE